MTYRAVHVILHILLRPEH